MAKEFIKIKRTDSLPAYVQSELKGKGILDGLVEIKISENSPKDIIGIQQSYKLFSQKLEEA